MCVLAKSLPLCSTLCDPMDCGLAESSVHGILQARILESVSMPSSRDLPKLGNKPRSLISLALTGRFLPLVPPGKPNLIE